MKDQMLIGFSHRQVLFICGLVNVEEGSTTSRWICRSTFLIPPFYKVWFANMQYFTGAARSSFPSEVLGSSQEGPATDFLTTCEFLGII